MGEKSTVKIKKINITNSKIGLVSKDSSILEAENVLINNVDIGAAAYIKKTEYGPANIMINGIKILNFRKKYIAQEKSEIRINNNLIKNYDCKSNKEDCYFIGN